MSDRAETRLRAYPMPRWDDLPHELRDQIADHCGEIFKLPTTGRVLCIDDNEAADGIYSYDELIDALTELGVTVFAQNLDNPNGIRARRALWAAAGEPRTWLIDPTNHKALIPIGDIEAAADAGASAEQMLSRFREPDLPDELLDIDQRLGRTPRTADLARFRGTFTDGYTEEDIDRVACAISYIIGVELCCVWEYRDAHCAAGSSQIVAIVDGEARELPAGLADLIYDGDGDGLIDGTAIPDAAHSDVDLTATCAWRSARGFNRVLDDRA